jgi:glycosyltransferase involved in cell wall biosynthesis
MPTVSICIPAYNNPDYLIRAIDSIIIQTFQDYEIIVTDDSPGDVLSQLVKERYSHLNNLIYIKNPIQLGSTANWNYAISMANSNLVKLLHHDDWFTDENSLYEFTKPFLSDPELDFVFCQSHHFDGKKHLETNKPDTSTIHRFKTDPSSIIYKNFIITPSATLYKKTALEYDTKLTWLVDADFYASYMKTSKFQYIQKPLISLNISKGRLTTACEDDVKLLVNEIIYLLQKYQSSDKIKKNILLYFRKVIRVYNLKNAFTLQKRTGISSIPSEMETLIDHLSFKDYASDSLFRISSRLLEFLLGENYKPKVRNILKFTLLFKQKH